MSDSTLRQIAQLNKLSFIWSGGSLGPDQFQVEVDGRLVGHTPIEQLSTPRDPQPLTLHERG
ncbi:MAG TPA: hypothetical protein VM221_11900 [Armatimonadota bacterium]|nr:hypothetical protein [Armatimonadota bacterium]